MATSTRASNHPPGDHPSSREYNTRWETPTQPPGPPSFFLQFMEEGVHLYRNRRSCLSHPCTVALVSLCCLRVDDPNFIYHTYELCVIINEAIAISEEWHAYM